MLGTCNLPTCTPDELELVPPQTRTPYETTSLFWLSIPYLCLFDEKKKGCRTQVQSLVGTEAVTHLCRHGSSTRPPSSTSGQGYPEQVVDMQGQNQATNESPARLPPRSRTGCWTCRKRKVKCDEARPVCQQCVRLGQTCDFGPRLNWKDDTEKVKSKAKLPFATCPPWNGRTPGSHLQPPRPVDDMAPFTTLTNEADREQKALWYPPGKFSVHSIPSTFSSLPEYRDDPDETTPTDTESKPRRLSSPRTSTSPSSERRPRAMGNDQVVLERFEAPSDRPLPSASTYVPLQRMPEQYYNQPYQALPPPSHVLPHPPQSYPPQSPYVNLPHRLPPAENTYHYQGGGFAAPPHPPQYPAPYQYAQSGMPPPYPQHPPIRTYTEPLPLPPPLQYASGSPYTSPTHHHPPPLQSPMQSPHSYSSHESHFGGHYGDPRSGSGPRQSPSMAPPHLPTYLPPAPNPYESSSQHQHMRLPGPPLPPGPRQYMPGQHMMGPPPAMGLEQYVMSGPGAYGAGAGGLPPVDDRYAGHVYYGVDGEMEQ